MTAQPVRPNFPTAPAAPPKPSRMKIANVRTGRIDDAPMRIVVYGTEGVGKSTFASKAPDPIFLAAERGTNRLKVARFPEPESWQDVLDAVESLRTEAHEHKTLVVDTLDWVEPMCWAHVCKAGNKTDIEGFGYGKGYTAALDAWRTFIARLERLCDERRMHVVLLAHSIVKTFKNPLGEDYDRYQLKLHDKASGVFKEWAEAVLFADYETFTKQNERERNIAVGGKERVLHTERGSAWDAKNRLGLPASMKLDGDEFFALATASTQDAARLLADLEELLGRVDAPTQDAVRVWLKSNPSPVELALAATKLRGKAAPKSNPSENTKEVSQ